MTLNHLHDKMITQLKLKMPALSTFLTYSAHFDPPLLTKIDPKLPAMLFRLAATSAVQSIETGERQLQLQFVAYLVANQDPNNPQSALSILEDLCLLIPDQRWEISGLMGANNMTANHLFQHTIQQQAVTVFKIEWQHLLRIGTNQWIGGKRPTTVYASDQPSKFGIEANYEQVN